MDAYDNFNFNFKINTKVNKFFKKSNKEANTIKLLYYKCSHCKNNANIFQVSLTTLQRVNRP